MWMTVFTLKKHERGVTVNRNLVCLSNTGKKQIILYLEILKVNITLLLFLCLNRTSTAQEPTQVKDIRTKV